jgi:hypothetical protein
VSQNEKFLKVAHGYLLWSGGEIPHAGRYGGHNWQTWLLDIGCTIRAHTQYKVMASKRMGATFLREQ